MFTMCAQVRDFFLFLVYLRPVSLTRMLYHLGGNEMEDMTITILFWTFINTFFNNNQNVKRIIKRIVLRVLEIDANALWLTRIFFSETSPLSSVRIWINARISIDSQESKFFFQFKEIQFLPILWMKLHERLLTLS